jgi:uroporphyrinogen decarboxylase
MNQASVTGPEYTSYERVLAALEHREPDRVPIDLGGTAVTGINIHALRRLKQTLGIPGDVILKDQITQLAVTDDPTFACLELDVRCVGPQRPSDPGPARDHGLVGTDYVLTDEWGMRWRMPRDSGHYYDLCHSPLAGAETVQDVENFAWPDPNDAARYVGLREAADRVVYGEQQAFILERMSSGMWEHAMWMRGYEQFFTDMLYNQAVVHAIMNKILEIKMAYWGKALEIMGDYPLIISEADDLGGQRGLLVSLPMYKKLIWPYHKKLFEYIKGKARRRAYIFFHNDGAVYPTLPLLIEAGVDIINPWQVNCAGMDDTARFKREFGRDLTIWGGSCDTQRVLPFGTPDEVRRETRRRIEDLAPGGGFIFAPIHIIQSEVPAENIVAWWETWHEYGTY